MLDQTVQTLDFSEIDNIRIIREHIEHDKADLSKLEGRLVRQRHLVFNPLELGFRTKELTFSLLTVRAFFQLDEWISGYSERVQQGDTLLIPSNVFAVIFDPTPFLIAAHSPKQKEEALATLKHEHAAAFAHFKRDLVASLEKRDFHPDHNKATFKLEVEECAASRASLVKASKMGRRSFEVLKPGVTEEGEPPYMKKSSIFSSPKGGYG